MNRAAFSAVLLVAAAAFVSSACEARREPSALGATPTPAVSPAALVRVTDASQVCMVNDQFMGKAQIPVRVDGKTYYGCCEMCKEKLEKMSTARIAVDPVSGKQVDKATAVLGRDPTGTVFYFESASTFAQYKP